MSSYRVRRTIVVIILLLLAGLPLASTRVDMPTLQEIIEANTNAPTTTKNDALEGIDIKGRAPKTGYEREQFGNGWSNDLGCDTRNQILTRDLKSVVLNEDCKVVSGTLHDPYTGKIIQFLRGETTSDDVQIDHVVALSNAWQTGAQQLSYARRVIFANDPLNLLAVDGTANEQKSDGDAATWLPPNKPFRCQYIKRQIAVKLKYSLWATKAEYDAMSRIISGC